MRQQHVAGHKAFVDYSGKRVPIADPATGEVRMAKIVVAVLGASSLPDAEATWTQTLPDWIGAHVRMFRFYEAAPRLLVPDNLESGVLLRPRGEPQLCGDGGALQCQHSASPAEIPA
jgi:transposase